MKSFKQILNETSNFLMSKIVAVKETNIRGSEDWIADVINKYDGKTVKSILTKLAGKIGLMGSDYDIQEISGGKYQSAAGKTIKITTERGYAILVVK